MSASVASDPAPSLPLAKYLSSSDKKTRDKAVKSLAQFLSVPAQQALSPLETAKLWKGIFYCYWMSDKPLVQQALSSELANILLAITSLDQALAFLSGFWEATVREWNGIDRLRMDKYYMIVRKFVNATLRLYQRERWARELVTEGNEILVRKGGPLCPQDAKVPTSLSFHIAEVFLVELDNILGEFDSDDAKHPAPLLPLLDPYLVYVSRTNIRASYNRIFDEVFNPLFSALNQQTKNAESPSRKRSRLSFENSLDNIGLHSCLEMPGDIGENDLTKLRRGIIQRIFDVANGPDARESNRKWMVAVWKAEMADESTQKITSLDAA